MDNQYDRDPMSGQSSGAGTAARMKETVRDAASEAAEKISDLGRNAADQIDSSREPIASTLDRTASTLRQTGQSAARTAHATAEKLHSTADYVRKHDLQAIFSDVQDLARRYPAQCLLAAVGVGFLLGRIFRNSD